MALEIAREEGLRCLAEQQSSADSARARVGSVFVIAAIGTGFLSPNALQGRSHFPGWAWIALGALAVAVLASAAVFWPRKFHSAMDPSRLASADWLGRTEEDLLTNLAAQTGEMIVHNARRLRTMWWAVMVVLTASAVSVIAWLPLLTGAYA